MRPTWDMCVRFAPLCCLVAAATACAPVEVLRAPAQEAAMESPRLHVEGTVLLARNVKIYGPPRIEWNEDAVSVSFVTHTGAVGRTWFDPRTRERSSTTEFSTPPVHVGPERPPSPERGTASLSMSGSSELSFWTDGDSEHGYGLLMALTGDRLPRIRLTDGSLDVLGTPVAAKVGEHRAVVAYYASRGDEVDLMATSVAAY